MKTLIIFVLLSTCNAFISTVNSFTVKSGGPTIKMLDYVPNQIIRSMNTRIIPEWSYSNFVDEISIGEFNQEKKNYEDSGIMS